MGSNLPFTGYPAIPFSFLFFLRMNCTRRQHQHARDAYHRPHYQHDLLLSENVDDHTLQMLSRQYAFEDKYTPRTEPITD
jgi:hypothetical protein